MFICGATVAVVNAPLLALVQSRVAPDMQGRVFALLGSLAQVVALIGFAIVGPVTDLIGVQSWFVAGGLAMLGLAVSILFVPAILQIEAQQSVRAIETG